MFVAYTFGQGLATAALAAFLFVWVVVAVRIVRRDDLSVLAKALWILGILLFPLVGLLVYFIWDASRPRAA